VKKDIRNYKRLVGFVSPHKGVLIFAFVCMIISSVLNSISPIALIPVVDNIMTGDDITINPHIPIPQFVFRFVEKVNAMDPMVLLKVLLIGALVYFLLRNLFVFFQAYLMNDLSQRVIRDVKDKLYRKLLSLSMRFFGENPTAKLMSRITYDAAIIRDSISTGLLDLMLRPMELISHLVAIIAIVLIAGIPLQFLFTTVILFPLLLLPVVIISRRLRKITTKSQEKMGDINTILFEIMTGIRIVKAFSMQEYEYEKFKKQNNSFYKLEMKSVKRMNSISPINEFTEAIFLVCVLYLAGMHILGGKLSWGSFLYFVTSVLLMVKPVKRLGKVYAIIQKALASAERVFDILDDTPDIGQKPEAKELPILKGQIEFKDIFFKYDGDNVLKNINFNIKKGDILAIVGPSGAGKTSLVNLVPRFYDPTRGAILLDGVDLRDVTLKSLRDQIGIVTQEMLLFNDTVLNNITYGTSKHSREEVVKAAKIANAHEFIMRLPDKYNTIIGERGYRLSGGEKQRVSIARAIFKNPPVLIFDEATSQLDTESERLVQEAIDRLMKGRTVFVIAHRLSTITHANKIIVLDRGRIKETGTHKELLDKNGLYRKLYEMQFQQR